MSNAVTLPSLGELELRRAQMFPRLSAAQLARVKPLGEVVSYPDGAIVFDQGDEHVPWYVVCQGQMEIVHPSGALEDLITTHQSGEFSGEVTFLSGRRALVRARAKGPLTVLRVSPEQLRLVLQTDSELSDLLMRAFILRRVGLLTAGYGDAIVIGSRQSSATLRVQEFLTRNGHPYKCVDVDRDPDVQNLLDQIKVDIHDIPILICRGTRVLKNPTDAEIADCLGFNPTSDPCHVYDVVICGAGPGGLAAAVYGASEGLDVLVVEAGSPGGQAASSSKIENYLGFPTGFSGEALGARALTQAEKFGARVLVARGAERLFCDEKPMRIALANGESIKARAIVLATGAAYRKLDVADLAKFEGAGVYYAATAIESGRCGEEEIIVVGGGNSAGQAATFLAKTAKHVHILIRSKDLAASMSRYLIRRIEETPNITLRRQHQIVALEGAEHLEHVTWRDAATGEVSRRPIRHVFSMAGADPNTRWLDGCVVLDPQGFVRTGADLDRETLGAAGWPLARTPLLFETSQPRVFAVGDLRSASVKRVASAVGEGSVCIQLVHRVLAE
jgi:thioredoxin reductase (NADPH)